MSPVKIVNDSMIIDSSKMDINVPYKIIYDGREFWFKKIEDGIIDVYAASPNQSHQVFNEDV